MKTALLIPSLNVHTRAEFWIWQTPDEHDLTGEFETREEALAHRPDPAEYVCRDDGYRKI